MSHSESLRDAVSHIKKLVNSPSEYDIEQAMLFLQHVKIDPPKKTIEERKHDFAMAVANNLPSPDVYSSIIKDFIDYWTEHSEGAKKMRFEKEKVFDIKKRLERWKRNQKPNYGKSTKPSTDEALRGFISGQGA